MIDTIRKIYLSIERIGIDDIDYENEHTDVIVELKNGDLYVASFFTYQYVETLRAENRENGSFLHGDYFWTERLVLTSDITAKNVKRIIEDLRDEGNFNQAFKKL